MNLLALESSAVACSAALCKGERLVAQVFQNNGLTHSRTLLPMVEFLLRSCGETLAGVDVIAVAAGPGSFTGLRIGISTAKGLAWPDDKPCAGVSTLEAMAWPLAHLEGEVCAVMDARRSQVYNGRFLAQGGTLTRLCPDRAIGLDALAAELQADGKPQILVGDGAVSCYTTFKAMGLEVCLAPQQLQVQSAWGVACAAQALIEAGRLTNAAGLAPMYHRLSQAERERLARQPRE